jgi:hypothetical protein
VETRLAYLASFTTLKGNVQAYGESINNVTSKINDAMLAFGCEAPVLNTSVLLMAHADEDTDLSNTQWSSNMLAAMKSLCLYYDQQSSNAKLLGKMLRKIHKIKKKWSTQSPTFYRP